MVGRWAMAPVAMVAVGLACPAQAAQVVLQADANEVEVGQSVFLTLTAVDGTPDALPQPRSPQGLRVQFSHQGQTTASVNMKITRLVRYVYRVTAVEPGEWTIDGVEVSFGGERHVTGPVTVTVSPRSPAASQTWRAEASFNKEEAYVGEVVLYRYATLLRSRALRTQWQLPTLDGLIKPSASDAPRREYLIEDELGKLIVEETIVPLVVSAAGKRDQPGAIVRMDVLVDRPNSRMNAMLGMRQTEPQVIPTAPARLFARSLPPAPPDFSGLVGDFELTQEVERADLTVGQSGAWTVRITGDGSLEGYKLPALTAVDRARVYDNEPVIDARVTSQGFRASAQLSRVVVPSAEGELRLPDLKLVTFSPSRGAYVTHTLPGPAWKVSGGAGEAKVERFGVAPASPSDGPEPEVPRPLWVSGADTAWTSGPWMLALWALTGGVAAGLFLARAVSAAAAAIPKPKAPVAGPAARLAALPADPEARLAWFEAELRERIAEASEPGALEAALRAVQRARYAGGEVGAELEASVRAALGLEQTR